MSLSCCRRIPGGSRQGGHIVWEGPSRRCARCVVAVPLRLRRPFVWVPGSLTPWGVTPREVGSFPALRLRQALSFGLLRLPAWGPPLSRVSWWQRGPGQRVVSPGVPSGMLVRGARSFPSWDLAEGRVIQLYLRVCWCAVLGHPGGLRWRWARKRVVGPSHPHPWTFLVLVPGLGQGWPSRSGFRRPVRGPPISGITLAHAPRRYPCPKRLVRCWL